MKENESTAHEIDLLRLLKLLWKHAIQVILVVAVFGIAFFCYAQFCAS